MQRNFTDASKWYRAAIKVMPADTQVAALKQKADYSDALMRGANALNAGNYAGAIAGFSDAGKIIPGDALAAASVKNAQQAQAAAAAGVAAKTRQDFDTKVAQANTFITQHKYAEASQLLNDAVKLIPTDATAQKKARYADDMAKGQAAEKVKNYREAVRLYTLALNEVTGDPVLTAATTAILKAAKTHVK